MREHKLDVLPLSALVSGTARQGRTSFGKAEIPASFGFWGLARTVVIYAIGVSAERSVDGSCSAARPRVPIDDLPPANERIVGVDGMR